MTKIKVDTAKLKDCGESILTACSGFNADINNLYSKLYNVPRTTKEWVGIAANNYASIVLKEKTQYVNYGKALKDMGNILIDYANDVEEAVKKTKI